MAKNQKHGRCLSGAPALLYRVGLTVAGGSERWFSGYAIIDRAAFCAFGRLRGGGLKLV